MNIDGRKMSAPRKKGQLFEGHVELGKLRKGLKILDEEIITNLATLFGRRKALVTKIGEIKKQLNLPVRIKRVEKHNIVNLRILAKKVGIPLKVVTLLFKQFALPESWRIQEKIIGKKLPAQNNNNKKKKSITKRGV